MIDVAIGDEHRADRRRTPRRIGSPGHRRDRRGSHDLFAQVGRGVQKKPVLTVRRRGDRGLRARADAGVAGPVEAAHVTEAVPLGIAAAGSGAQYKKPQAGLCPPAAIMCSRQLEFDRHVAVDFHRDADFRDNGLVPGHCHSPKVPRPTKGRSLYPQTES